MNLNSLCFGHCPRLMSYLKVWKNADAVPSNLTGFQNLSGLKRRKQYQPPL